MAYIDPRSPGARPPESRGPQLPGSVTDFLVAELASWPGRERSLGVAERGSREIFEERAVATPGTRQLPASARSRGEERCQRTSIAAATAKTGSIGSILLPSKDGRCPPAPTEN